MFVDFSETQHAKESLTFRVDTIYHLDADASYQVCHKPVPSGKSILLLVTGGNGAFRTQEEFRLQKGNVLLTSPDTDEFFYRTIGDTWQFWWFEFSTNGFFWEKDRCFRINPDLLLERQCENCLELLKQGKEEYASSVLGGILAEIARQIEELQYRDEKKEFFYQAQQIIHHKLAFVTVAQIAAEIGMGERELRSLFHTQAGCSPKKYIIKEKLEMACFLLKNTRKSIGEISEELGFSSQFHFSKVFKEAFGSSPAVWREKRFAYMK